MTNQTKTVKPVKVARPVFDKELAQLESLCAASLVALTIQVINYFN
jgi:hypothetical protein